MDQSYTTSLFTDRYELTMLDASIRAGIVGRQAIFDVYARSLPDGRRFGILCGTGRLLELLDKFYFSEEDLNYLQGRIDRVPAMDEGSDSARVDRMPAMDEGSGYHDRKIGAYNTERVEKDDIGSTPETTGHTDRIVTTGHTDRIVSDETIEYLRNWHFSGTIRAYGEGECYFAGSPVLTVEAPYGEAQLLETIILSVLNHDSAIASAAARMSIAAEDRQLIEMGSRRTNEYAAVAAARAAYIGGFHSTANLEAGRRYGIPTAGTAAHSFTLAFPTEREAFQAQLNASNSTITALVDTYDMESAIRTAAEVAGKRLGAIRIDSGDLAERARQARSILDSLQLNDTRIICTGDLDEYKIHQLRNEPIDVFGVGTALVAGSGHPAANFIYKLVAIERENGKIEPVAKLSPGGKATPGGIKYPARIYNKNGQALSEYVGTVPLAKGSLPYRPLQKDLILNGEIVDSDSLDDARNRCRQSINELGRVAYDISPGSAVITTQRMPKRALIVIDTQNDFCEGGSLAVNGGNKVARQIADLIEQEYLQTGTGIYDFVIATRDYHEHPEGHFSDTPDYHDTWPPHCIIGTTGAELNSSLNTISFNAIFDKGRFKPAYSGFEGTETSTGISLESWLVEHKIGCIDIVGIATDYCVRATALDASKLGLGTRVLTAYCAGVSNDTTLQALNEMDRAGIVIV